MNIAIFNVKYSPNLGDGIIALCLESALMRRLPAASIRSIDLAGRCDWTEPTDGRSRARLLTLLQSLPPPVRDFVVSARLERMVKRLRPVWRKVLEDVDCAIFGGGQLFQDGDLNFPIKIAAAAEECRRLGIPMAIYAAGAAPSSSRRGRQLFSTLTQAPTLAFAAARDDDSRSALLGLDLPHVAVCRDPGLLVANVWKRQQPAAHDRAVVGLGVTHPAVLAHHSDEPKLSLADAERFYSDIAIGLSRLGYVVRCFTNGAAEDELLLTALHKRLSGQPAKIGAVEVCARSSTPRDLVALISSCDAIIGHRLHAAIVAYSYAIPHVGLRWDGKLAAFFESVDRGEFVIPFDHSAAKVAPALVAKALSDGIDGARHARVLGETEAGIDQLVHALGAGHHRAHDTAIRRAGGDSVVMDAGTIA